MEYFQYAFIFMALMVALTTLFGMISGPSSQDLEQAAKNGDASALASLTWRALNNGSHLEAINRYNLLRDKVFTAGILLDTELANLDNNHALNLLGSGKTISEVRHLWDMNKNKGQEECEFYSIIADIKEGLSDKSALSELDKSILVSMEKTLREGKVGAKGWYREWCEEIFQYLP